MASMRPLEARSPDVDRANAALEREIAALQRQFESATATTPSSKATPSNDAVVERSRARVRALERELALANEEREREREMWISRCERQATELRALAASAESRARIASEDAEAAMLERDEILRELKALRAEAARRAMQDAEIELERAAFANAKRFADARTMRRALVRWIEGCVFNIAARHVIQKMDVRRKRDTLMEWRDAAAFERRLRETRARGDLRLAARVFRHWSLFVEVSGMCERSRLARALARWKSYDATDEGTLDDVEIPSIREKYLALVNRVRRREIMRGAFTAWIVVLANAKSARALAMEILRDRERGEVRSSLAKLKARRVGAIE